MRLWLSRVITISLMLSGCQTSLNWTDYAFSLGQHTLTSTLSPTAVNTCVELTLSQVAGDGTTPVLFIDPVTVDLTATKNGIAVSGTFYGAPGCVASTVTQMTFAPGQSTLPISFRSTISGSLTLRATATNWSAPALTQEQTPDVPDAGQSTLTVAAVGPTLIANGSDQAQISGYIRDQYGNGLPGAVTLSVLPGTGMTLTPSSITADANGLFTANLTISLGNFGVQNISITSPVVKGPIGINFTDYPPILSGLTVTNPALTNNTTFGLTWTGQSGGYDDYCILENDTNIGNCSWMTGPVPASVVVSATNNTKILSAWLRNTSLATSTRVDSNPVTLDTVGPVAPNALTLFSPSTTPANDATPTIRVSGVVSGDTVRIFTNSSCTMPGFKGSLTATASTVDITSTALSDGAYVFYADALDPAGNSSGCSTASFGYTHDGLTPQLTSIGISNPSPTNTDLYVLSFGAITGSTYTQYCILENDTNVSSCAWTTGTLPPSVTVNSTNNTKTLSAWVRDDALNTSTRVNSNAVAYDNVNPVTATALGWGQTSPQTVFTVSAAWTRSVSGDLTNQILQYYTGASCGTSLGAPVNLGSASAITHGFTAPGDNTYSYNVTSIDTAGNQTVSACSSPMLINTTGPALTSATVTNSNPTNNATYGLTYGATAGTYDSYCILENNTNNTSCVWTLGTLPGTYAIAGADGPIVLSIWLRDSAMLVSTRVDTNSVTLDRANPTAPTIALQTPASSPGNNATPTLRVSGVSATDTVGIYLDDSSCGVGSLRGSLVATGPTADVASSSISAGAHTYYAKTVDAAGNGSTCSSTGAAYFLDLTAPAVPSGLALWTPATSPNNVATPTIRVSGVASGDTVKIFSDNTCTLPNEKGSGTASGATIDLTSTTLSNGIYTFYAKATDAAGNSSACSTANVGYDYDITSPAAPSGLSLLSPATSPGSSATPTLRITGTTGLESVGIFTDASCTTQRASIVAGGTTTDLTSSTLAPGAYNFYAQTWDSLNNKSACVGPTAYVYDNTAPAVPSAITLTSPASTPGSSATPTFLVSGVVSGDTITIHTDNTCTLPNQKATGVAATTTISLASSTITEGVYTYYTKSTDTAGNASACIATGAAYEYDATAPTLSTLSVTNPNPTNSTTFTLNWGIITGVYSSYCILVNDTNVGNCGWIAGLVPTSKVVPTGDGVKIVSAWIRDAAANVSNRIDTSGHTLDQSPPNVPTSLSLINPVSSPGTVSTPTIRVNGVANGDTVSLYADSSCTLPTLKGSGLAGGTSINIVVSSALAPATYQFYATSADSLGNQSACSTAFVTYQYSPGPSQILVFDDGGSYNFGVRAVGSYADKIVYVTNISTVDDATITGSTITGGPGNVTYKGGTFPGTSGSCAYGIVAKQSTCAIIVRYVPTLALLSGTQLNLTYSFAANPGVNTSIAFEGQGTSSASFAITDYNPTFYPNFGIPADGAQFNFGSVGYNVPYTHTFYFVNRGATAGTLDSTFFGFVGPPAFTYAGGTCAPFKVLQPDEFCTVKVTWTPPNLSGTQSTLLKIFAGGSTYDRDLQGTIVGDSGVPNSFIRLYDHRIGDQSGISVGPSYSFGPSGAPTDHAFFVQNTGNAPYNFGGGWMPGISGVAFTQVPGIVYDGTQSAAGADGDYGDLNYCGGTLAAGAACVVAVRFNTGAASVGNNTGSLTVAAGVTRSLQAVKLDAALLSIKYIKPGGGGGDGGLSFDWGYVARGVARDEFFEVRNVGVSNATAITGPVPISGSLTYLPGASFPGGTGNVSVHGNMRPYCTTTLSPGSSCVLRLRFNSTLPAGNVSSTLRVNYYNGVASTQVDLAMDARLFNGPLLVLTPYYGGGGGDEGTPTFDTGVLAESSTNFYYFRLRNIGNMDATGFTRTPFSVTGFDFDPHGAFPGGIAGDPEPNAGNSLYCPDEGDDIVQGADCLIKLRIYGQNVGEFTDKLEINYIGGPLDKATYNIHTVITDLGIFHFQDTLSGGWTGGDLDFGIAGIPQVKTLIIKNDGGQAASVTGGTLPAGFSWASPGNFPGISGAPGTMVTFYDGFNSQPIPSCGDVVLAGSRCAIRVAFNPVASNDYDGEMTLTTTGTADTTISRRLRGESTLAAELVIRENPYQVPGCPECAAEFGQTSSTMYRSFVLMNVGGSSAIVQGQLPSTVPYTTGSPYFSNYSTFNGSYTINVFGVPTTVCGSGGPTFTMNPGTHCAFQVMFDPTPAVPFTTHSAIYRIESSMGQITKELRGQRGP